MIEKITKDFMVLDEVDALLLGGSRATGVFDENSDYDIYVYLNKPLDEFKRKTILDKYCKYMEYSNEFWELEDDGILNNDIEIEFIYRNINDIEKSLHDLKSGIVGRGYTTCFLDNLLDSKILFDKTGKIQELKDKHRETLNRELAQKIVDENYVLLNNSMPALYNQVKKAVERQDLNSINHRLTEFFAMYYDILFAINLEPHPGEKRLIDLSSELDIRPKNFNKEVENVFIKAFVDGYDMLESLLNLCNGLDDLLIEQGYIKK